MMPASVAVEALETRGVSFWDVVVVLGAPELAAPAVLPLSLLLGAPDAAGVRVRRCKRLIFMARPPFQPQAAAISVESITEDGCEARP